MGDRLDEEHEKLSLKDEATRRLNLLRQKNSDKAARRRKRQKEKGRAYVFGGGRKIRERAGAKSPQGRHRHKNPDIVVQEFFKKNRSKLDLKSRVGVVHTENATIAFFRGKKIDYVAVWEGENNVSVRIVADAQNGLKQAQENSLPIECLSFAYYLKEARDIWSPSKDANDTQTDLRRSLLRYHVGLYIAIGYLITGEKTRANKMGIAVEMLNFCSLGKEPKEIEASLSARSNGFFAKVLSEEYKSSVIITGLRKIEEAKAKLSQYTTEKTTLPMLEIDVASLLRNTRNDLANSKTNKLIKNKKPFQRNNIKATFSTAIRLSADKDFAAANVMALGFLLGQRMVEIQRITKSSIALNTIDTWSLNSKTKGKAKNQNSLQPRAPLLAIALAAEKKEWYTPTSMKKRDKDSKSRLNYTSATSTFITKMKSEPNCDPEFKASAVRSTCITYNLYLSQLTENDPTLHFTRNKDLLIRLTNHTDFSQIDTTYSQFSSEMQTSHAHVFFGFDAPPIFNFRVSDDKTIELNQFDNLYESFVTIAFIQALEEEGTEKANAFSIRLRKKIGEAASEITEHRKQAKSAPVVLFF